ncbi:Ferric reductase, NADH/NADPH oxidase and related proteins [Ceraceosorus bombacis]|uniref:Ferric reductase, NADH/NADPH oxidase and related proteins n=1 Tax=Ceraceosorus bombacis TaxID=401625 RepID=A0A0N7LA98_9BASI|nr:Ferric reductase, NADH/NADPH oxidase and related proteins [Ceraceosorus bombacis]
MSEFLALPPHLPSTPLLARHIQNFSEAASLQPHWGYAARALPCTNDAGSCAYLDTVYRSHDLGMLYVGIFWALLVAVLLLYTIAHRCTITVTSTSRGGGRDGAAASSLQRAASAARTWTRSKLMPDIQIASFRATRQQVLVFAILLGYVTVFTFVGIVYQKWVTPVKKMPGVYNTRTGLGPWSDRIGVWAYALTPLSILLSTRESLLSLLTGIPYHHFNFMHRWLGWIILIQSLLHTIGWSIVQGRLYQPQPSVGAAWIKETYMVWGVVAMILLTILFLLSLPVVIRRTGHEFFRKAHYILAMLYIGACWGHWDKLKCFLLPSLLIWGLDRGARLVRTFLLHHDYICAAHTTALAPIQADVTFFDSDEDVPVVRLDLTHQQARNAPGDHYFLTFSSHGSIWQSHPFTSFVPAAAASHAKSHQEAATHSFIMRAKGGETRKVAKALLKEHSSKTSLLLTGPYGNDITSDLDAAHNALCLAGGTGITFVLPVLRERVRRAKEARLLLAASDKASLEDCRVVRTGTTSLVWLVRHQRDAAWAEAELAELRQSKMVEVKIISTRDGHEARGEKRTCEIDDSSKDSTSDRSSPQLPVQSLEKDVPAHNESPHTASSRPSIDALVESFLSTTSNAPSVVYTSGPGDLMRSVRRAVATANNARLAWRGEESRNIKLIYDERLE